MLERLLWAERTPVDERERALAANRIAAAHADGGITADSAVERQAKLAGARTRDELRASLDGLSGLRGQVSLPLVTRVASALWLAVNGVELVVWVLVSLISGTWDDPWWLWTLLGGGAVVAGLWKIAEWEHHTLLSADGTR